MGIAARDFGPLTRRTLVRAARTEFNRCCNQWEATVLSLLGVIKLTLFQHSHRNRNWFYLRA
jgi:hypothetical protein